MFPEKSDVENKQFVLGTFNRSILVSYGFLGELFKGAIKFPANTILVYETKPIVENSLVIGIQFNVLDPILKAEYSSFQLDLKPNHLVIINFPENAMEDEEDGDYRLDLPPFPYPCALFGIPLKEEDVSNEVYIRCELAGVWFKMYFPHLAVAEN